MARTNGKSEVESLDTEHELPASDGQDEGQSGQTSAPAAREPVEDGELARLKAERDALVDRLARLQAEFDNARKRSVKEQQDYREYAVADAVKALLPILDSFERALQPEHADSSEFRNGVELIHKQLQDALAKLGLRPIPAQGKPF